MIALYLLGLLGIAVLSWCSPRWLLRLLGIAVLAFFGYGTYESVTRDDYATACVLVPNACLLSWLLFDVARTLRPLTRTPVDGESPTTSQGHRNEVAS